MKPRAASLLAFVLAVALSGCAFTVTEGAVSIRIGPGIIEEFEPRQGEGATYYVGEEVSFVFRSRLSGYVTLASRNPDDRVETFARNLFVPAGRTVVLDGRSVDRRFVADRPTGRHDILATFSEEPGPTSRLTLQGVYSEERWRSAVRSEVRSAGRTDRATTVLYVR
jgi:hypothetical protein